MKTKDITTFKVVDPKLSTYGCTIKMEKIVSSISNGKLSTIVFGKLYKDETGKIIPDFAKIVYPISKLELV